MDGRDIIIIVGAIACVPVWKVARLLNVYEMTSAQVESKKDYYQTYYCWYWDKLDATKQSIIRQILRAYSEATRKLIAGSAFQLYPSDISDPSICGWILEWNAFLHWNHGAYH